MFGNGVSIGMQKIIIRKAVRKIRRVQFPEVHAFCAAVLGTSMQTTVVLRLVAGTIPAAGSAASGSGFIPQYCSPFYFYPFTLYTGVNL